MARNYEEEAKEMVKEYTEKKGFNSFSVFVVWSCKVLQNRKFIVATSAPDTRIFEATYNGMVSRRIRQRRKHLHQALIDVAISKEVAFLLQNTMVTVEMHFFCTIFALFLHWLFVYNSCNMEYSFTKERLAHFRKMSFDDLSKLTFKDFTVTELKCLIAETPMKDEMKRASVAFYIKRGTYQEVADELHCSIDTAKRHRKRIRCLMLQTIINMFFNSEDCEED